MNIEQFYHVRKNVIEMLEDRGLNTRRIESSYPLSVYEELFNRFKTGLPVFDILVEEEDRKTLVKFLFGNSPMFYKRDPTKFINIQSKYYDLDLSTDKVIVIICDEVSDGIISGFNDKLSKLGVNIFNYKSFFMNITKHVLVPQHILLSKDVINKELSKYNINNVQQLPKMLKNDPISKYYDAHIGDVFKIVRKNQYNGKSYAFRIVV